MHVKYVEAQVGYEGKFEGETKKTLQIEWGNSNSYQFNLYHYLHMRTYFEREKHNKWDDGRHLSQQTMLEAQDHVAACTPQWTYMTQ